MPIDVIHPDGESPGPVPRRNAAILGNSYFLDRFVVAVTSIVAAIGLTFGFLHVGGLRSGVIERTVSATVHLWREEPGREVTNAEISALETNLLDQTYAFDPFAPIYEQFAQFTVNVLTWPPITVALLACGVLAVTAQRYAY